MGDDEKRVTLRPYKSVVRRALFWWLTAPVLYIAGFCFGAGPAIYYVQAVANRLATPRPGAAGYLAPVVSVALSFVALVPLVIAASTLFDQPWLIALVASALHALATLPFCMWVPSALEAQRDVPSIEEALGHFARLTLGERIRILLVRIPALPLAVVAFELADLEFRSTKPEHGPTMAPSIDFCATSASRP